MSARSTLKRTWPVLASYAIFSMWGIACFTSALVFGVGGFGLSAGAYQVMAGILAAVAVGHVIGNGLGLAGFRLVPITIIFFGLLFLSSLSGLALGVFVIFLWIAVIAAYGGYLGIASRLDVVASWYPLMFCVGGAIIWMNTHGAVKTFHSGEKHQMWDAFTIICLAGGVFWMLVFLATRNSLGLTVWQEVSRPRGVDHEDVAVARPGRGSILVLMAFTVVVLGATALISPYLFRTGPADCKEEDGKVCYDADGDGQGDGKGSDGKDLKGKKAKGKGSSEAKSDGDGDGEDGQGGNGKGKGKGKKGKGKGKPEGDPDTDGAAEAAAEAAKIGMKILAYLLVAAAIMLFFYLVVFPPIRRAFLMRHLEKPLWPVAPTSRVMNQWRRALAILRVAGVEPSAGETETDFAVRAAAEIKESLGCESPGLDDAAKIVEKIAFAGRGLGTADEQAVREAIDRFVKTVEPRIKLTRRIASKWGRAPEVEA